MGLFRDGKIVDDRKELFMLLQEQMGIIGSHFNQPQL